MSSNGQPNKKNTKKHELSRSATNRDANREKRRRVTSLNTNTNTKNNDTRNPTQGSLTTSQRYHTQTTTPNASVVSKGQNGHVTSGPRGMPVPQNDRNTPFPWAKVAHAHSNGDDLVLKPGDEVEILGVDSGSGYGYGQCGDRDGLFPLSVLKPETPALQQYQQMMQQQQLMQQRQPQQPRQQPRQHLHPQQHHEQQVPLSQQSVVQPRSISKPKLKAVVDISEVDPLFATCISGTLQTVQALIQNSKFSVADLSAATRVCCKHGRLDILQLLFDKHARLHNIDSSGRTTFHIAAENNHVNILTWLMSLLSSAMALQADSKGCPPLHLAALNGHVEVVSLSLKCSPNHVQSTCRLGKSVLMYGCQGGHISVMQALLNQGATANGVDAHSRALLHIAAASKDVNLIKWISANPSTSQWINVNAVDKFGLTPLHMAVAYGSHDVAMHLVKQLKANPLQKDSKNRTPLHVATRHNRLSILKFLTTQSIIPRKALGPEMKSLGIYAIKYNQHKCLKYLIEIGLDLNIGSRANNSNTGATMLHHCAVYNRSACMEIVLNPPTKPSNNKSVAGSTRAHRSTHGFAGVTTVKVEVNQSDRAGWTALHVAASRGWTSTVKWMLLTLDADWKLVDNRGLSAFHTACRFGNLETAKLLSCCGGTLAPTTVWGAITQFVTRDKSPSFKRWLNQSLNWKPIELCLFHGQAELLKRILKTSDLDLDSTAPALLQICDMKGSLASTGTSAILMAALEPYSASNHSLFGPRHRAMVATIMMIKQRIDRNHKNPTINSTSSTNASNANVRASSSDNNTNTNNNTTTTTTTTTTTQHNNNTTTSNMPSRFNKPPQRVIGRCPSSGFASLPDSAWLLILWYMPRIVNDTPA